MKIKLSPVEEKFIKDLVKSRIVTDEAQAVKFCIRNTMLGIDWQRLVAVLESIRNDT